MAFRRSDSTGKGLSPRVNSLAWPRFGHGTRLFLPPWNHWPKSGPEFSSMRLKQPSRRDSWLPSMRKTWCLGEDGLNKELARNDEAVLRF